MRCYSHLSDDEREQIGLAKAVGHSIGAIAKAIGHAQTARAAGRGADLAPGLRELREAGTTSLGGLARALTEPEYPYNTRWQRVDPYAGRADHGAFACWDVSGEDDDEVTRADSGHLDAYPAYRK